jgi:hypothetical protein
MLDVLERILRDDLPMISARAATPLNFRFMDDDEPDPPTPQGPWT